MLKLSFMSLMTIVAVLAVWACKSPEQRIVEWYEDARAIEAHALPAAAECHRYSRGYWQLVGEMNRVNDQLINQMTEVAQMRARIGPSFDQQAEMLRSTYAQTHENAIEALIAGFRYQTGWTEDGVHYCSGKFTRERDPSGCQNLHTPGSGPEDWFGAAYYGSVEYCIENQIAPFD